MYRCTVPLSHLRISVPLKGFSARVGRLKHFEKFITSPNFDVIFMNTLKLSFGLIFSFPVPILLALMLNQVRRAAVKKNIQLFLYAPISSRWSSLSGCCLSSCRRPINQLVIWMTGSPLMFMSRRNTSGGSIFYRIYGRVPDGPPSSMWSLLRMWTPSRITRPAWTELTFSSASEILICLRLGRLWRSFSYWRQGHYVHRL